MKKKVLNHRFFLFSVALVAACATTQPTIVPDKTDNLDLRVIPRGRFVMGFEKGEINERPAHQVVLAEYRIDRHEVSAIRFAEFLNAEGNPDERYFTPDDHATVVLLSDRADGDNKRYAPRPGLENFPANNVSWYGADAFCRWKNKRLPTEAEWEKAARGPDKRRFPWGKKPPTDDKARLARSWDENRLNVLVPVDALPAGASYYDILNMSGNVMEWVQDWYRQNLCDFCSPDKEANLHVIRRLTGTGDAEEHDPENSRQIPPRENPTGPSTGSFKVLRGGSWWNRDPVEISATHRFWLDPAQRFPHTGFRCADSP